ncbi:MAG: hypothetical protein ACI9RG_000859 [Sulfurimonas sp.]|jgi:hypothetical protein
MISLTKANIFAFLSEVNTTLQSGVQSQVDSKDLNK